MAREQFEQGEFASRETNIPTRSSNTTRGRVELEVTDLERWRAILKPPPTERADARSQLIHAEGFREVVIRSVIETLDPVLDVVKRCQHEDRRRKSLGTQGRTDSEAIESGKDDIEDHQVVRVRVGPVEGAATIADGVGRVTIRRQRRLQGTGDGRFILDDQDSQS